MFIARDATGQIVWLETGNKLAGLEHIIARHAGDFKQEMEGKALSASTTIRENIM